MKLYLKRQIHKDTKGFISRQTVTKFLVHARLEVTPRERELIETYQLGEKELYEWEPVDVKAEDLRISINVTGLIGEGQNMRFIDFVQMIDAEATIHSNAQRFAGVLAAAEAFETEAVFEF